jgi:large-conductance mechanosensitive channel
MARRSAFGNLNNSNFLIIGVCLFVIVVILVLIRHHSAKVSAPSTPASAPSTQASAPPTQASAP